MTPEEQAAADKAAAEAKVAEEQAAAEAKAAQEKADAEAAEALKAAKKAAEEGDEQAKALLKAAEDEKATLLKETMKRKEQAKKAQEDAAKAQKELDEMKKSLGDLDLEQISKLAEEQKEQAKKALEAKGEYEQIVTQIKEQHETAVEALKAQLKEANDQLLAQSGKVDKLTVGRAFSDSEFIREKSTLPASIARQTFASYFDSNEQGQLVAFNAPRGTEGRAPLVDAEGNGKSFEEAIADLYNKHPDAKTLIKTEQKPGAGSNTGDLGGVKKGSGQEDPSAGRGLARIQTALAE